MRAPIALTLSLALAPALALTPAPAAQAADLSVEGAAWLDSFKGGPVAAVVARLGEPKTAKPAKDGRVLIWTWSENQSPIMGGSGGLTNYQNFQSRTVVIHHCTVAVAVDARDRVTQWSARGDEALCRRSLKPLRAATRR